jgi:hypothetical protein
LNYGALFLIYIHNMGTKSYSTGYKFHMLDSAFVL